MNTAIYIGKTCGSLIFGMTGKVCHAGYFDKFLAFYPDDGKGYFTLPYSEVKICK